MAFPYSNPLTSNTKTDRNSQPSVPVGKKVMAQEWNEAVNGINALATALTAGEFLGLAGGANPEVAPAGGVRAKAGAAGLEVSFDGGAYAPVGGTVADAADGVAGKVSTSDQVMGAGGKTFKAFIGMQSAPTAPVAPAGEVRLRNNANVAEISANGGAYVPLLTTASQIDTPQSFASSGGQLNLSFASHRNWYTTLTESATLNTPTNVLAGMAGCIEITNGTSLWSLLFSPFWKFSGGLIPNITPTPGARDKLFFYVGNDTTYATCRLVGNV